MGTLQEQVAIVTGAGSGIGKAIALLTAREGAFVTVADLDPDTAANSDHEIHAAGGKSTWVETDVADPESVAAMVEKTLKTFGRIDALVNNAGIDLEGKTTSFTTEAWQQVLDINLGGTFLCSRACLPTLQKQGGVIVNIASVHALFGFAGAAAYDASKGGVVALTRSLTVEYGPQQIRVNAICPGYIDTPLWDRFLAEVPDPEKVDRQTRENHPLRRRGLPTDVAHAARFLLSDESNWITGTTLVIDGGMGAQYFEQSFE